MLIFLIYWVFTTSLFMEHGRFHWHISLYVISYLKHAQGRSLLCEHHGHLLIEAYFDSNYVSKHSDQKSTSNSNSFVGGNLVPWRSLLLGYDS